MKRVMWIEHKEGDGLVGPARIGWVHVPGGECLRSIPSVEYWIEAGGHRPTQLGTCGTGGLVPVSLQGCSRLV